MLICEREELVISRHTEFRSHPAGFLRFHMKAFTVFFFFFSFFSFYCGKHEVLTFYLVVAMIGSPLPTFPSFVHQLSRLGTCLLVSTSFPGLLSLKLSPPAQVAASHLPLISGYQDDSFAGRELTIAFVSF